MALTRAIVEKLIKENKLTDIKGKNVRASVRASGYGQHDANWIGFYDYFRNELNLVNETEKLQGLTRHAGWYLPHEGICWVSERQCIVLQDANKRLHCETGPAVKYPDGWVLYYWHGVKITEWIIENPRKLNVKVIEGESNAEIRRVMIHKYGMSKYLEESGAEEINRDRDTKGERKYQHDCMDCGTEFTFLHNEAKETLDQRDGDYLCIKCPVCGVNCFCTPKLIS